MPPTRRNKVTKASATAPVKTPPAATRASSTLKRRHSLQGAKTSRLAPSEPLHMTTRRAARTASNHTSPAAPSVTGFSSRRSSLNDLQENEDAPSGIEDEQAAKRARLSTDSGSRRASTGSSVEQGALNGAQTPGSQAKAASRTSSDASKSSSKKRRASDESIESTKTGNAQPNRVLAHPTDNLSEPHSRNKRRRTTQAPSESIDQPPELTDASTAPNSPEQLAEVDSSQNLHHVLPTNGDAPAKVGRRLPGRRRAPHSDVNVETDLRRQLNLKMDYRRLAKVQKTILEELSNRSANSLESDPDYYKQCPEYEPLMAALDEHKERRLAQVDAQRTEKLAQLERVRVATEHIEKQKYIQRFRDYQEDMLLQCFHRLKQLERQRKGEDGTVTDDESNIVPATHMQFPPVGNDDRLGSKYASRSRAYVETERMVDEEIVRRRFDQTRKDFVAQDEEADDSIEDLPAGFGAFIGPDRTEAIAHYNINNLADAAAAVQNIIPNEQADALYFLASLSAERPQEVSVKQEQHPQVLPPMQVSTPVPQSEITRHSSPVPPFSIASTAMSLEMTAQNSPAKAPQAQSASVQGTPLLHTNGLPSTKQLEAPKSETPARVSSHRIMDLLNDADVPVSRSRESQPPAPEHTPSELPPRRENFATPPSPPRGNLPGLDAIVNRQGSLAARDTPGIKEGSLPPLSSIPPSSPSASRFGSHRTPGIPNHQYEDSLRRRDPLDKIREMLQAIGKGTASERPATEPAQPPAPSQYQTEQKKPAPTPPVHRSPYLPPSAPQLPPLNQTLPPKPAGPPPSGPINFRFAHYDPVPPSRPGYPPSAGYPPVSHPPPPPHYGQGYSGPPSYQGGYVPPPGSFQAPPPPPQSMSPYPPLKIHQYGGQLILPANMAPPPQSQPPMAFHPPPPPAFSPPQQNSMPQRNPSYEQPPPPSSAPHDMQPDRSQDSQQARQRRQYRSYQPPGSQFRPYQGPDSSRRRGG